MRTSMASCVVVIALALAVAGCSPAGDAAGAAGAGEGEGEGEGEAGNDDNGLVCAQDCTGDTQCAQDNCGFPFCQPLVTTEGASCDAPSVACDEGGSHPCADGLECTGVPGSLTCARAGEAGAPCDPQAVGPTRDGCADAFVCLPEQATCAPACAPDGTCSGTDECIAGACFPALGEGAACPVEATIEIDTRADGCADGVRCGFEPGTTAPVCIRDECLADDACPGGACHFPSCFLEKRTCAELVGEGGTCFTDCDGGGCTNFTESCAPGLECRHDFNACPGGNGTLGTCVVPSGPGGSCSPTGNQETDGCEAGEACDPVAVACL